MSFLLIQFNEQPELILLILHLLFFINIKFVTRLIKGSRAIHITGNVNIIQNKMGAATGGVL